jgi:hypothetical protein
MKPIFTTFVTAAISALAYSASAQAAPLNDNPLGVSAAQEQAERTVRIDSNTRWVNVKRMETVRFELGHGSDAKAFTWRFDGQPQRWMKLNEIAPEGALGAHDVTVYVARNEQLDGGR